MDFLGTVATKESKASERVFKGLIMCEQDIWASSGTVHDLVPSSTADFTINSDA
jgi:hypothetical protein